MNNYILITQKFEGYLSYKYDAKGYLIAFQNCAYRMTESALEHVLTELRNALTLDKLLAWTKQQGITLVKLEEDLSFDRFWKEYDNARNKLQAEVLWKKLSSYDKQYIFHVLAAYKHYCKENPWYTQMYPDTFLRSHWRDEWFKVLLKEKANKQ